MNLKKYDYCVVGAGPSGLTTTYELLKANKSVLLIEREPRVGGLAKSYDYDGQIFDIGPKRFHTDDQVVLDFIHEVIEKDFLIIDRTTKVYFLGKYFEWPLQTKDLLQMPVGVAVKCFFDLVKKREIDDPASFHQYIYSKYGENLYKIFFEPYTKKFLRWDPEDIHSDWASTGINRTTIDKRVKSDTLLDLLRSLILPAKIQTKFIYPAAGGFGGFYEKLLSLCRAHERFGLIVDDQIVKLNHDKARGFEALTRKDQALSFDDLIWTGNLNDLCRIISSQDKVPYLNTVFYNLICKEEGVSNKKAQWIYVSRGDSLISRITCMKEFAPYTCLDGYSNIICELTDSQAQPIYFKDPANYTDGIVKELESMSFIKNKGIVEDIKVNPVRDTYPIYHKQYIRSFAEAVKLVKQFSGRIHLCGRCGAFWYNNSDHTIRFALELAKKLLGKTDTAFDYRNYFGGGQSRAESHQGT